MVRDLRSAVLGQKVANIYDINEKTYLFKFASPGSSEKVILLMESGVRFHTTKYSLAKSDMPSPFAMKLRKYIRSKRIDDIRQLSFDRVVDFKFGSGETANHIILELYSQGNIVLTDANYEILALLRSHLFEDDVALKVGEIYPMQFTTVGSSSVSTGILDMDLPMFLDWAGQKDSMKPEAAIEEEQPPLTTKKAKVRKSNLRLLLMNKDSGIGSYGGEIIDHCLLSAELSPTMKLEQLQAISPDQFESMKSNLRNGRRLFESLNIPGQFGYILWKAPKTITVASPESVPSGEDGAVTSVATGRDNNSNKEYIEFVPIILKQHEGIPFVEFPSFDEAVDEYFSKVCSPSLSFSLHYYCL